MKLSHRHNGIGQTSKVKNGEFHSILSSFSCITPRSPPSGALHASPGNDTSLIHLGTIESRHADILSLLYFVFSYLSFVLTPALIFNRSKIFFISRRCLTPVRLIDLVLKE